jgi:TonB-linked SusC/RagA family outer membrane protein
MKKFFTRLHYTGFVKLVLLLCCFTISGFSQVKINGNVTDRADKEYLPGVSVVVKGTTIGTATDETGGYSLIVPDNATTLIYSFIGYSPLEVQINDRSIINVALQPDVETLQEIVVIGYGSADKKELVSAVSSVGSDVLENQPVVRVDQALQGRAAGVEVTSTNGAPGAASTIRIRGASSIQANNNPLFVVDGFIVGTNFDLNNINVNDIESIEVLKDATALSVYGTRGAAGVVLITTKSGKKLPAGKPAISINHYSAMQKIANEINILDGEQYINYVNEAARFVPGPGVDVNGTIVPLGMTDSSIPLLFEDPTAVPNTDWMGLITRPGNISNTDLSITGNNENMNYYISMNYFDQKGILKGSGLKRLTVRNNLDVNISEKLIAGVRINVSRFKRENNKVDFSEIVNTLLPIMAVYDDDGNYNVSNPISGTTHSNPVADIDLKEDHNLVTNLVSNAYLEYELFRDFRIRTTLGAELDYIKGNYYISAFEPERLANNSNGGYASVDQGQAQNLLNENTVTFNKEIDSHSFHLLGGFTWQENTFESSFASAEGFPNDVVKYNSLALGSDPATYQVNSGYSQRTLASFLGRLTYIYKDKYIMTWVGRRDGSSVFEAGNKWAFFPSVGVAWNIDEEKFITDNSLIKRLKLRASYGIIGEEGIAPYNSFSLFSPTYNYFNENLAGAVIIGTPASTDLKWETTKQLDIGFEVAFGSRINFEVDYYKKNTEDLLLFSDLPNTAGNRQLKNVGSIENRGFEFTLNTVNLEGGQFRWESTLILSSNRSKVLDLGDEEYINLQSTGTQAGISARLIEGKPMPVFTGAEYLGTYKTAEEIIEDGQVGRSFLGSPRFRDIDGNGVINEDDYIVLGSPQPDFYGGIRNSFSYKGLFMDIFFQGQYGNDIFNVRSQTTFYGRSDKNLDPIVVDRWIEGVNESSDVPRAGTSNSTYNPNSSVNIEDGSFLRLKSVSLGYDLPLDVFNLRNSFKRINVYISGNNLLLLSKFRLGDPEVSNFSAGSGFNSVSPGFATGQYPYARTISVGAKIQF